LPPARRAGLAVAVFPLSRRLRLAGFVEGDRLANERFERGLINLFSFVQADPDVVEEWK
jgi:hypothetical protein